MMLTLRTLVALFALGSTTLATSIYSDEFCLTKLGKTSIPNVPSSTKTISITLTAYSKVTTTPVKTITPPPVTTTIKSTTKVTSTTTASPKTQTVTSTSTTTIFVTSTSTSLVTSTVATTTQVTSTSTSTVPTPAGFTPVSQETGYVPKIKGRTLHELGARASQPQFVAKIPKDSATPVFSPALYPTAIDCIEFIESVTTKTSTYTASTTSTTTIAPKTSTTTSTVSTTTTTTKYPPDVTSTVTTSTTVTSQTGTTTTITTTISTTATETVTVPGPTVYAACAANNIVTTANRGEPIAALEGTYNVPGMTNVTTAADCCAACFRRGNGCKGSAFLNNGVGDNDFGCVLFVFDGCTPGQYQGDYFETYNNGGSVGFAISNGPCGAIADGGSRDE